MALQCNKHDNSIINLIINCSIQMAKHGLLDLASNDVLYLILRDANMSSMLKTMIYLENAHNFLSQEGARIRCLRQSYPSVVC